MTQVKIIEKYQPLLIK